jgi:hypothetical protein
MASATHNLRALDLAELAEVGKWADQLLEAADWTAELAQPFDDAPTFDAAADPEVNVSAGLRADLAHKRLPSRRLFVDYRANMNAYKHLDPLPGEGESLHGIISGKYALWDLVPALIERTGQKIEDLMLATLSFSKANAADLLGLLDDGQVKRAGLLISYFFKAQSRPIYDCLVPQLKERGHRVLAMRTHAKLLLARMADGTCYVCESSANLRSCKNVEQFVLTRCAELYAFHRGWIDGELLTGREEGE